MEQEFITKLLAAFFHSEGIVDAERLAKRTFKYFDGLHLIDWSRVNPSPPEGVEPFDDFLGPPPSDSTGAGRGSGKTKRS